MNTSMAFRATSLHLSITIIDICAIRMILSSMTSLSQCFQNTFRVWTFLIHDLRGHLIDQFSQLLNLSVTSDFLFFFLLSIRCLDNLLFQLSDQAVFGHHVRLKSFELILSLLFDLLKLLKLSGLLFKLGLVSLILLQNLLHLVFHTCDLFRLKLELALQSPTLDLHLCVLMFNLKQCLAPLAQLQLQLLDQLLCALQLALHRGHLLAASRVVLLSLVQLAYNLLIFIPDCAGLGFNSCQILTQSCDLLILQDWVLAESHKLGLILILFLQKDVDLWGLDLTIARLWLVRASLAVVAFLGGLTLVWCSDFTHWALTERFVGWFRLRFVWALRRHLWSALRPHLFVLLLNLILFDHLIDLLDHGHLLWYDFFQLFDLPWLLDLQNLTTWGLTKHEWTLKWLIVGRLHIAALTSMVKLAMAVFGIGQVWLDNELVAALPSDSLVLCLNESLRVRGRRRLASKRIELDWACYVFASTLIDAWSLSFATFLKRLKLSFCEGWLKLISLILSCVIDKVF